MIVPKALHFAAKKHKGQIRKFSELPYIIHPMTVMYLISKYKGDSKHIDVLQCAALLHDTLEDTGCTYVELEREFGPMVASIVMELTSDEDEINRIGKNEYLKLKMVNMSNYAFILKLLDRLANISDNPFIKYVEDTKVLIDYILLNRTDITHRQMDIIKVIVETCDNIIQNEGK